MACDCCEYFQVQLECLRQRTIHIIDHKNKPDVDEVEKRALGLLEEDHKKYYHPMPGKMVKLLFNAARNKLREEQK